MGNFYLHTNFLLLFFFAFFSLSSISKLSSAYHYNKNNYYYYDDNFPNRWLDLNRNSGFKSRSISNQREWSNGHHGDDDDDYSWNSHYTGNQIKVDNHHDDGDKDEYNDLDGWESWNVHKPNQNHHQASSSTSSELGFFDLSKGWTGQKTKTFRIPYRTFKFGFPVPVLPKVKFAFGVGWKWPTTTNIKNIDYNNNKGWWE